MTTFVMPIISMLPDIMTHPLYAMHSLVYGNNYNYVYTLAYIIHIAWLYTLTLHVYMYVHVCIMLFMVSYSLYLKSFPFNTTHSYIITIAIMNIVYMTIK